MSSEGRRFCDSWRRSVQGPGERATSPSGCFADKCGPWWSGLGWQSMVTIPGGPSLGSSNGILVVPRGLFREKGRARSHRCPRHTSVGQRERLWRRSSRVEVENDSFNSCIAGATCTARVDARQSVANRAAAQLSPRWSALVCCRVLLTQFVLRGLCREDGRAAIRPFG